MLSINKLKLFNFIKYKEQELLLKNLGLVLLKGRNLDEPGKGSNASGKTIILDAIKWLWSGVPTRRILSDRVVGNFANSCYVEGEIESNNKISTLIRYRKDKKYANSLRLFSGFDVSHRSVAITEERLNKIIGCSINLLNLSCFFNDDYKYHFSKMNSEMKSKIFDEIIGTDESDIPQRLKKVNKKIRENENIIRDLESEIVIYRNNIDKASSSINGMYDIINNSDSIYKDQIKKYDVQIADLSVVNIKSLENDLEDINNDINKSKDKLIEVNKIEGRIEEYRKELTELNYDKSNLEGDIAHYEHYGSNKNIGSDCDSCGNRITKESIGSLKAVAKKEIDKDNKELDRINKLLDDRTSLIQSLRDINEPFKNINSEINSLRMERSSTDRDISDVKKDRLKAVQVKNEKNEYNSKHKNYINGIKNKIKVEFKNKIKSKKLIQKSLIIIARLNHEKERLEMLAEFYGPKGFRPLVMRHYSPVLSEASNFFLTDFTGGTEKIDISSKTQLASGELRDKININVLYNNTVKSFPEEYSKGEGAAIDISLNLGLMRLSQIKAKKDFGLYFFDEATDGLSPELIDRFFDVLKDKICGKNKTAIITTHNPVDEKYFDAVWCAVRENGCSRIEIEKQ